VTVKYVKYEIYIEYTSFLRCFCKASKSDYCTRSSENDY